MTPVSDPKCETCASARGVWDTESGRPRFWCERGLMGIHPCKAYSREPGSDDDR